MQRAACWRVLLGRHGRKYAAWTQRLPALAESFALIVIQEAARSRFGSEVTCGEAERCGGAAPRMDFRILRDRVARGRRYVNSLQHKPRLGGRSGRICDDRCGSDQKSSDLALRVAAARNSADILMHVEMPVTIVLGRTTMRLKDLLKLTNGSVVELDQMLDEEVEVRVNNCVIAYGEVVAVDGNYAVRILRMAAARNTPTLEGNCLKKQPKSMHPQPIRTASPGSSTTLERLLRNRSTNERLLRYIRSSAMKIESNLLNISMSQSDRVQEPSKPDSSSSSPKAVSHGGGGRCRAGTSGRAGRDRTERRSGRAREHRPVLARAGSIRSVSGG